MKPKFDADRMKALRAQGMSNKQIAVELGCSAELVRLRIGKSSGKAPPDDCSVSQNCEVVMNRN